VKKTSKINRTLIVLSSIFALSLSANIALARSSDRDNPTPVTSSQIDTSLPKGADVFYGFDVSPGKLQLTLDVKPLGGSIGVATLSVTDGDGRDLGVSLIPTANSPGGDRKTATIDILTNQRIILRLKEGTGYGANCRIKLAGSAVANSFPSQPQ
jgi:hypothetical protein